MKKNYKKIARFFWYSLCVSITMFNILFIMLYFAYLYQALIGQLTYNFIQLMILWFVYLDMGENE